MLDTRAAVRENAGVLALLLEPLSCSASRWTWVRAGHDLGLALSDLRMDFESLIVDRRATEERRRVERSESEPSMQV